MRIVGGVHRGRALAGLGRGDPAAHLRPTSDRVRESLFNILAGYGRPQGARVLDLFAGSGALGLEALSRGAATATFVETGRPALRLLHENIRRCGAADAARVVTRDARRPRPSPGPAHDLVFLDPPYGKGLGEAALGAALSGGWIDPGALIVWEESARVTPPEGLRMLEERRYGDTMITFLEAPAG